MYQAVPRKLVFELPVEFWDMRRLAHQRTNRSRPSLAMLAVLLQWSSGHNAGRRNADQQRTQWDKRLMLTHVSCGIGRLALGGADTRNEAGWMHGGLKTKKQPTTKPQHTNL